MLILMEKGATPDQIEKVCERIRELGYMPHEIPGSIRVAIGITGNQGALASELFSHLEGVAECVPVSRPYKLVSREVKPESTVVEVRGARIGDGRFAVIAGPCSVESRDQVFRTAEAVSRTGAKFFRGGAFKPRTSPYAFQGLKEEGLRLLEEVKREFDLRVVTEVKDTESLKAVAAVADVIQIGARNMQHFTLLEAAGQLRMPVLLKRGMSATLQELFMAAEYILSLGNYQVILCERGIRTYETSTRNTTDINAIPVLKALTHLPVILDPSHSTGHWQYVTPVARAGIAAGADGLMVEVHPNPEEALSDGGQSLKPERFAELVTQVKAIAQAVGRDLAQRQPVLTAPAQPVSGQGA